MDWNEQIALMQRDIFACKYKVSIDQKPEAKRISIDAINKLNSLLKSANLSSEIKAVLKQIGNEIIELHQSIQNEDTPSSKGQSISNRILWISSNLNNNFYPPVGEPNRSPKLFISQQKVTDELPLSNYQQQDLVQWEKVYTKDWGTNASGLNHIYQDYLQDCSFVASIISINRVDPSLLLSRITPHCECDNYGVILTFNGCDRLVEIGNELPILKSKSLFIKSLTNKELIWPAFLEKAYLKVFGHGYDSQGSNFGIDTYMLTSWIPEFWKVSEILNYDELFDQLVNSEVVVGLGTKSVSSGSKLLPNHDYSVIKMVKETKTILIKNPLKTDTNDIISLKFEDISEFDVLYTNWRPKAFHERIHFILNNKEEIFFNYPQFKLKNTNSFKASFQILLEQHLNFNSFSNVLILKSSGERLFYKTEVLKFNKANNSKFHYSQISLQPHECVTVVVLSDKCDVLQRYTIHAYSDHKYEFTKATSRYSKITTISDKFDVNTCGGNWTNQGYIKNPRYLVETCAGGQGTNKSGNKNKVMLGLFSSTPVNYQLFWNDENIFKQKGSLINEKYNNQVISQIELEADKKYQIVLSTFEKGIEAEFKLILNSEKSLRLTKLSNDLGLFNKTLEFQWNNKNRFKQVLTFKYQSLLSLHIWSPNEYKDYRPKIRVNLFDRATSAPISINEQFDDCFFGVWLRNVKVTGEVIMLVERFEIGDGSCLVEIGCDNKFDY